MDEPNTLSRIGRAMWHTLWIGTALFFLSKALIPGWWDNESAIAATAQAAVSPVGALPQSNLTAIEDVRLGSRTLGDNPEMSDFERAEVDDPVQETWRQVDLEMIKARRISTLERMVDEQTALAKEMATLAKKEVAARNKADRAGKKLVASLENAERQRLFARRNQYTSSLFAAQHALAATGGQLLAIRDPDESGVISARFSPDELQIASAGVAPGVRSRSLCGPDGTRCSSR